LATGAFRGADAVRSGLLTRRQLDGDSWHRLFPDVYVRQDVPLTHELRAEAAALLLPDAVVTGRSAAVLWGVPLADVRADVEVTLPPTAHPRRIRGLYVRRAMLRPADRLRRLGVPVTSAEATAVRLSALLPRDDAVAAVDQLVATGFVSLGAIRRRAAESRGPGSALARAVCAEADGLAESPQETRLRLLMVRSELPPPVAQFRVVDDSGFVARVDFAWPEQKVALEYDGHWHAESCQFARDRRRLNRLQAAGWRVVFVTAADLHRPIELVARVATALLAAAVR
jgi:G:T-mismatch repair DNA endonuclease (very short patch repair protein)